MACPGVPNATPTCTGGACGFSCTGTFRDCNNKASDGCEVDTSSSSANCGACGVACTGGLVCQGGTCVAWNAAGATWTASGHLYGRYTWAQAAIANNGYANANAFCTGSGGTLARPNSQAEWDALWSNLPQDSTGYWMDGNNDFTCGTATPGTPKPYSFGLMYSPTGTSLLYTGCNCNTSEPGLVVYRYNGSSPFDGCEGSGGMQVGFLGAMDEWLTYNHPNIVGFVCMK
jgi:hypothetical protein